MEQGIAQERKRSVKGLGPWTTPTKRAKVPEERDWERMLDCLSLGPCHLFK
jgi:hypothetical protein